MRADRLRICKRPKEIYLGSYGFPDNAFHGLETQIERLSENGARAIVLKGFDHTGRAKRLAMTIYAGFTELTLVKSRGTNPDSENSIVIYAKGTLRNQYDASEPVIFISQVITRDDDRDFTQAELFPLREILYEDVDKVTLVLRDGSKKNVDYAGIEGRMSL